MKKINLFILLTIFVFSNCYAEQSISKEKTIEARKQFQIKVLKFDASQEIGTSFPYSDYVRLQITNKSKIVLPCLTVMTYRYDNKNKLVGSSRSPSIPTYSMKPGETAEYDYYPKGHLPGVSKIKVEVEKLISKENLKFIYELNGNCP